MVNRKKRLEQAIKSLEEQKEKHFKKMLSGGKKDTTRDYWKKEIIRFEKENKKKQKLLKRKANKASLIS